MPTYEFEVQPEKKVKIVTAQRFTTYSTSLGEHENNLGYVAEITLTQPYSETDPDWRARCSPLKLQFELDNGKGFGTEEDLLALLPPFISANFLVSADEEQIKKHRISEQPMRIKSLKKYPTVIYSTG